MKNLFLILSLVSIINVLAQEESIPDKQFMLWITGVGPNEQVTHSIEAAGVVWEYASGNFVISNDPGIYNSSLITIGNANFSSANWPGFNFKWTNQPPTALPSWGLGLYKVTNSKQPDKYFYLDARDAEYASGSYNPDFKIYFNTSIGKYIQYLPTPTDTINKGDIVRIWDIFGESPNTSGLQNYWNNVLVVVPSVAQPYTPRIIWGPIPNFSATGYKVYWRYGGTGNFSLLATVGANTYEYTHEGLAIGNGLVAEYKVQAYNGSSTSDFSNTVSIGTSGWFKQHFESENNDIKYLLNQNYPNPFNPTTVISFSIAEKSLVSLKVFDVLGNEVSNLVDEIKEKGNYSVAFDASVLTSGIYFYTLKANGYSFTKKMILAK